MDHQGDKKEIFHLIFNDKALKKDNFTHFEAEFWRMTNCTEIYGCNHYTRKTKFDTISSYPLFQIVDVPEGMETMNLVLKNYKNSKDTWPLSRYTYDENITYLRE